MELTEDQYFASKDENMDELPKFQKIHCLITAIQPEIHSWHGQTFNLMPLTLTTILIKVINKKLLH